MHITFLTQVLPYPLDAGPKIRAYYTLRYLAQTHDVTLVSFVRSTDSQPAIDHLRTFCREVHTVPIVRSRTRDAVDLARSLATGKSFIIGRDWIPAMVRCLEELAAATAAADAVHADQLWMAPYAAWFKQHRRSAPPPFAVLDQHNAVYMIFDRLADAERNPIKRALLRQEARKLARFEVATCQQFDAVTWVTEEDYAALQARTEAGRRLPNNGVIPICGDPDSEPVIPPRPGAKRVTFLGGLHYPPNAQGVVWFARHVFPAVLGLMPDVVFTVIGKNPPAELLQMGIPTENLEITGYVADPRPYLAETAVFLVPLLAGGGMRVKIIDGWCWGLPMVSTAVGAEGIEVRDGENIILADEPTDFAHQVARVLSDRDLNAHLRKAGRRWVEEKYDWRVTYRAWDRIYQPGPSA